MTDRNAKVWLQHGRYEVLKLAPHFGYGAMKLTFKEDFTIPTLSTDGQFIRYNPDYVENISTPEVASYKWAKSAVLHESMHPIFGHCKDWGKLGYKYPRLVNIAQDHAINLMILKMGLPVHPTWYCDKKFSGMPWQEIYEILVKEEQSGQGKAEPDGHGGCKVDPQPTPEAVDGEEKKDANSPGKSAPGEGVDPNPNGSGDGSGGQKGSEEVINTVPPSKWNDWDRIVIEAAKFAESIGKCPSEFQDYAREIVKPRYNWRATLYRFMSQTKKGAYSFRRPNKRYIHQGLVMPSLHSWTADAILGVDSSGSTMGFMPGFFGHVAEVVRVLGVPIDVAQIDTEIQNVFKLKRPEDVKKLAKDCGGGTDFRPFFEWVAKRGRKPEVVIFFTDGLGDYPEVPPPYKVLWCIPDAANLKTQNPDYYPKFGLVIDIPSKDLL